MVSKEIATGKGGSNSNTYKYICKAAAETNDKSKLPYNYNYNYNLKYKKVCAGTNSRTVLDPIPAYVFDGGFFDFHGATLQVGLVGLLRSKSL